MRASVGCLGRSSRPHRQHGRRNGVDAMDLCFTLHTDFTIFIIQRPRGLSILAAIECARRKLWRGHKYRTQGDRSKRRSFEWTQQSPCTPPPYRSLAISLAAAIQTYSEWCASHCGPCDIILVYCLLVGRSPHSRHRCAHKQIRAI